VPISTSQILKILHSIPRNFADPVAITAIGKHSVYLATGESLHYFENISVSEFTVGYDKLLSVLYNSSKIFADTCKS